MTDWRMTSPESVDYNCIAWAAGEDDRFWWPDLLGIGYWPPGAVRRETLDAFVEAYGTLGYAVCADGILEEGFEKVALFTRAGKPTHAARQLRSGAWTSKLGCRGSWMRDLWRGRGLSTAPALKAGARWAPCQISARGTEPTPKLSDLLVRISQSKREYV
jgi:hypothetical protein